jgi:hypothetical protein
MFGITCVFLLRVRIGMVATMFGDFFKTVSFFAVLLRLVIDVHWIPFGFRKKRATVVLGVVLPSSSLLLNIRAWLIDHHCMINQQFLSYLFFPKKQFVLDANDASNDGAKLV